MRLAASLVVVCLAQGVHAQPKPPTVPAAAPGQTPSRAPTGAPVGAPVGAHRGPPSPPAKPPVHRPAHRPGKPPPPKPPVAPAPAPAPPAAPEAPAPPRRTGSGLPVPRFASLKTDDVNFRRGPGSQYPVDWVYKRRDLPVEIEREFDNYRLVRDPDGTRGWVHQATLTGRRTAVVEGERVLRDGAAETGAAVAKLKPGVIVRLRRCEPGSDWCQVTVGDYGGYLKRSELWGLLPGEAIP